MQVWCDIFKWCDLAACLLVVSVSAGRAADLAACLLVVSVSAGRAADLAACLLVVSVSAGRAADLVACLLVVSVSAGRAADLLLTLMQEKLPKVLTHCEFDAHLTSPPSVHSLISATQSTAQRYTIERTRVGPWQTKEDARDNSSSRKRRLSSSR